ncbi:MAG: TIGR03617 family F420-dependent LLM class oxidoreductase [Dehalococcoidia bacterium]|nr:TIGR03617 family F420-dependent LLM class oxidoreductase [Dehalococcoidia bacterium]
MKVEAIVPNDLAAIPDAVRRYESLGYDGVVTLEVGHDPMLGLLMAAEHSTTLSLGTAVLIAFPRAPMVVAQQAWDIQRFSKGRLVLGLGSQVKGHITRRYSTEWHDAAAPRMREYVTCLKAIWDSWQNGAAADFKGEYYQYTLITPNFNPGPIDQPFPRVMVSAVNKYMARVAGQVCDGVRMHGLNSPRYIREVLLPSIEAGLERSGRSRGDFEITMGTFIASGASQAELEQSIESTRKRIAFYGSTRSYQKVLELHGWDDLVSRLHRMSVEGRWDEMAGEVSDDMLSELAVIATYDDLPGEIERRLGGLVDCVELVLPATNPDEEARAREVVAAVQKIPMAVKAPS